jgi:hypothetical protein
VSSVASGTNENPSGEESDEKAIREPLGVSRRSKKLYKMSELVYFANPNNMLGKPA